MNFKVILFFACLICTLSVTTSQKPVVIPADCAQACPPTGKKLCAMNPITKQLGTFESDCTFGRYNSCFKITQQYEFVKYGDC